MGPLTDPEGLGVETEFDPDTMRVPKRLRRIAVRTASLPVAAIAVRSRRAERQARRKRERRRGTGGVEQLHVDS